MAAPTLRPSASKNMGLCLSCHSQLLEVLSPERFLKEGRAADDEGYWMLTVVVDRCHACAPSLLESTTKTCFEWLGYDMSTTYDICLTSKQHAEAITSTMVGAVADCKESVHNGNIQLANMRGNSIVGGDIGKDTLYKEAVFQVWPYVTALLSSQDANRNTFSNFWVCCAGRYARLRSQKYITLKNPFEAPKSMVGDKSVEEQIFGSVGHQSDIPGARFIYDAHSGDTVMTNDQALAVQYGPTTVDKLFYANTPANIQEAVQKRITEKHVDFDMTDAERNELIHITEQLCEELRSSPQVDNIAQWLLYGDLKSKKWTPARAELALTNLMCRLNPSFEFSAAIKLEPMGKGKPPRMLIADGDSGAVMSALVIGVLERYICKYYKKRTIKGQPKCDRMHAICGEAFEMRNQSEAYEAFMLENDGSAWDTCCKLPLRDMTENRVIDVMFERLEKYFLPYNHYKEPRKKADGKAKYKLQINTNKIKIETMQNGATYTQEEMARAIFKKRTSVSIDSIRRSGDRGTSILNWIINALCWSWVLCGSGGRAMQHPNGKVCTDIFSTNRRFKIWLEGDDSLLWLTGRVFTTPELEVLEQRWTKLGHRPKLYQRKKGDVAEFCGWKIVVNSHGLDVETAMPDVPRLLANCFYTTAHEAVQAARDGDTNMFGRVVGPALLARAGSIADRVPSVARWLVGIANDLSPDVTNDMFSRDDLFRLGQGSLEELIPEWWKNDDPEKLLDTRYERFSDMVNRQISNTVATGGLRREADLAIRHGWVKTSDEWFEFVTTLESVSHLTNDEAYRRIVPSGMM